MIFGDEEKEFARPAGRCAIQHQHGYAWCSKKDAPRHYAHPALEHLSWKLPEETRQMNPYSIGVLVKGMSQDSTSPGLSRMYISGVREGTTALEGQQVADLQVVFLGQRCPPINGEQRLTGYFRIRRNHQMAQIVRHNDESVREGYIRNGGKEVKLFTSTLKAFQCNNRIVMAQRKHLDDFYMIELLDDWNVHVPSWKYPRNLESPRVSSPGFGNDSKMMVM
ncbi:uncharacterized protein TNCV_1948471 [Trichonephila clavipes]|nr:uncharacterized protein TNCV_1948471 [Trichonephila clavipes]